MSIELEIVDQIPMALEQKSQVREVFDKLSLLPIGFLILRSPYLDLINLLIKKYYTQALFVAIV